jgi:DNA-binding NarL/FixJ family response regulator
MTSKPSHPRVLLVEGKVQVRLRLAGLLQEGGLTVLPVASAEEALEVLGAIPNIRAVITNGDLPSPDMTGLELACKVHEEHESKGVVLFGLAVPKEGLPFGILFLAEPLHPATLVCLVHHVVGNHQPPDPSLLRDQIISAAQPPTRPQRADRALTPRQRDIVELLKQGKSNRDIAQALSLSEHTVAVHMHAMFRTLRVSSRAQAALAASRVLQLSS